LFIAIGSSRGIPGYRHSLNVIDYFAKKNEKKYRMLHSSSGEFILIGEQLQSLLIPLSSP
jgi:hypothetical protein